MSTVPYPLIACAATSDTLVLASNSSVHVIAGGSSNTIPIPSSSASTFIRQLAISPDSKHAVTVSNDKGLRTYDLIEKKHLSTRYLTKKPSSVTFTDKSTDGLDIIVSDKVGDCYLYPLVPRDISSDKVKIMDIQADPTLNPEATYLLGHVSVLTAHILTEDEQGKWLISADRDEHIRVTRYPNTYVIERYMFGTDGFVSSIHIPKGHPELLLSAGGEGVMRLWNWKTGKQVGSIDIADTVLPYRRARSSLRKDKRKLKGKKAPAAVEGEVEGEKDFYHVPEGWMLPSGQGILIRNITTLEVGGVVIVLFYSEGAAALHSFILPSSESSSPTSIKSFETTYPILNYTLLPESNDTYLLTLDTTFGPINSNQLTGQIPKPKSKDFELNQDQKQEMERSYRIVQVKSDGSIEDLTSTNPNSSILSSIVTNPTNQGTAQEVSIATLNLYPDLSLFPRWPGFEEDDDLAGPAVDPSTSSTPGLASTTNIKTDISASTAGPSSEPGGGPKKEYTTQEYESMNLKHLGRLKAQGYPVDDYMRLKRRETKDRRFEAKRARLEAGGEVEVEVEDEGGEDEA